MKTGLVLEGGAMRGMFTAGVLSNPCRRVFCLRLARREKCPPVFHSRVRATRTHHIMFHLVYRKHPALTRGFHAKIRKITTPNLFVFSKSMTLSKNTETS